MVTIGMQWHPKPEHVLCSMLIQNLSKPEPLSTDIKQQICQKRVLISHLLQEVIPVKWSPQ
jgi:hypothetical protein